MSTASEIIQQDDLSIITVGTSHGSPSLSPGAPTVTSGHIQQPLEPHANLAYLKPSNVLPPDQLVKEIVTAIGATEAASGPTPTPQATDVQDPRNVHPDKAKAQGSRLEFKTIDEVWDATASRYKIVESSATSETDTLDEYIFVVRMRIDKKTEEPTYYIDVKSHGLRDIFREVLQNVNGISLKEDKPSVERNLLYHYLHELETYSSTGNRTVHDPLPLTHLGLLVNHIKSAYTSTTQRLIHLLDSGEITFDLLWTLFKPKEIVYGKCIGTEKPRCIEFDFGEIKTPEDGREYFHIDGRYLDYNGEGLCEASTALGISKFRGAKRINTLEAFPLKYHCRKEEERKQLIDCGRRFVSLIGKHHKQYHGCAFFMSRGKIIKISVHGRIIVDAGFFLETNPNYTKPRIDTISNNSWGNSWYISVSSKDKIKSNAIEPAAMSDGDYLICSPTVLGFSLVNKQWLEFAVSDISDISWNAEPFEQLDIDERKKKLILALATFHTARAAVSQFDDFVVGKGKGLILLLHGPPGVGKTLTAEGLSEKLQLPLYQVSSGEISDDPYAEDQLSSIFKQASRWNAILLLDEADVFMRQRSMNHTSNKHITLFLRTLEYYEGIMFLTTNRIMDFDDAIQSRIHLAIKLSPLGFDTRRRIWKKFLDKIGKAEVEERISDKELDKLAKKNLNGRQIRNALKAAHALASFEDAPLSYTYLENVLELGEEFEWDFKGAGQVGNLNSYA